MSIANWSDVPENSQHGLLAKVTFVSGKYVKDGFTFLPVGSCVKYDSVYDPELGRRRAPRDGERPRHEFLVNGVTMSGEVRVFGIGKSVANQIGKIKKAVGYLPPVTVAAEFFGEDTMFTVTQYKGDARFPYEQSELFDLQKFVEALTTPAE